MNHGPLLRQMTMKNSFLVSATAAALFATTGLAAAQSMNQGGAKGGESPAAASPKTESTSPSISEDRQHQAVGAVSSAKEESQSKSKGSN